MRCLSALLLCFMTVAPAQACSDIQPFRIERIKNADAIFVGQPLKYERVPGYPRPATGLGFLKVRVHSVLKGQAPKVVRLVWGSNFGIPDHLDLPREVIIAAHREKDDSRYNEIIDKRVDSFPRSQLFHLMGSACSAYYILDYSPQNVENIKMLIRGEQVSPHDYRRAINLVAERASKQRTTAERRSRDRIRVGVIAFGVWALVFGIVVILRRKRAAAFEG